MKKVLYLANVFSHFTAFHKPFISLLQGMGMEVHAAASDNDGYSLQEIRDMGVICHDIAIPRNPFSRDLFRVAKTLKKLLIDNNYDLIHVHTPVASFLGRLLARNLPQTKVIYTAHGFHFYKGAPLLNWLIYFPAEYIACKWTDALICMNKEDYSRAVKLGFVPNKDLYFVHGVGLDIDAYQNNNCELAQGRANRQYDIDNRYVICVGELSPRKNQQMLIKAWEFVAKRFPDIKLVFVGMGEQQVALQALAKDLRIDTMVQFMGFRRDVPALLQQADMLVLVSKHEGLPRCIMEAMASCKPIVASNVRGNQDLIADGVNGFLVNLGDVQRLAERIMDLLNDETLVQNMGCLGYTKIQEYNIDKVVEEMHLIYNKFLCSGEFT